MPFVLMDYRGWFDKAAHRIQSFIPGPADFLPELFGFCIVGKNKNITFIDAYICQSFKAMVDELASNTLSAIFGVNGEVVKDAATTIVSAEDCSNEPAPAIL
jgi:hypothetical protein